MPFISKLDLFFHMMASGLFDRVTYRKGKVEIHLCWLWFHFVFPATTPITGAISSLCCCQILFCISSQWHWASLLGWFIFFVPAAWDPAFFYKWASTSWVLLVITPIPLPHPIVWNYFLNLFSLRTLCQFYCNTNQKGLCTCLSPLVHCELHGIKDYIYSFCFLLEQSSIVVCIL